MSIVDIRPALRAFLLSDTPLSNAVGGNRIFPAEMPQGEARASLVFSEISNVGDHTMTGPSGLAKPRMQITAWAPLIDDAYALALKAKQLLDGYKGTMGEGAAAVVVQGVFFDTSRDLKDDVSNLRGRALDFFIWFEER